MKHFLNKFRVGVAALVLIVAFSGSALASNAAYDSASDPAYAGGFFVALNGGYGFKPWSVHLSPVGTTEAGSFIGSSTVNGPAGSAGIDSSGGKAFGLVAAVGTQVMALRPFENFNVLSRGQTVSVDFDNGLLPSGLCLVALYNGLSTHRVSLRAAAGDSTYKVIGVTTVDTAVPITANGIHVEFTLTSDPTELFGTIAVAVTPVGGVTRTVSVQLGGTEGGSSAPGLIGIAAVMTGVGSGNANKFFVNNVSVGYRPASFSLTVNTNGNGTVAKMPNQSTYLSNTLVTLTATPAAGWAFAGWSGAARSIANPLTVVMDTNTIITANFSSTISTISTRPIDGFNPDVDGAVLATAIQKDGKIVIGGSFTSVGGRPHTNIARLNVDGTVDDRFSPSADSYVLSLAVQEDGKILVGGIFTTLSGQSRSHLGRLNVDGALDAFNPGANNTVSSLAVQADGRIVVGGYFTQLGGQPRSYIGRLDPLAALVDPGFNPGISGSAFPAVNSLALQPNGRILIGGLFTMVGGWPQTNIARLQADGGVDTAFTAGANDRVNTLAVQPDGKILMGGLFTTLCGQHRNQIGRLMANGSLDRSFDPGAGSGTIYEVNTLALQSDGKILVGGSFTALGGVPSAFNLGRLKPDGSVDPFSGAAGVVRSLAVQADGKIVVGGAFTLLANQNRNNLGRLYPDGSLDTTLNPGADGSVLALAVQGDGKILAGGNFITLAGQARRYIGRLYPDGNLDTAFNPGAIGSVLSLLLQPDSKIVAGGAFTVLAGRTCNGIGRLLSNGAIDTTFNAGADDIVRNLALQLDGKILIGGDFRTVGGQTHSRIARLNPDGTPDGSFNPTANAPVRAVALQRDGRILVGGLFTTINGQPRNHLARLQPDGSLDADFNPGITGTPPGLGGVPFVTCLAIQTDGRILVGGYFTSLAGQTRNYLARLDTNGGVEPNFNPGQYFQVEGGINCLAVQADHKILAGGRFLVDGEDPEHFSFDRLVRINENGSFDKAFRTGGTDGAVLSLAVQTDGKVVAGGDFTVLNDWSRSHIGRFSANGPVRQALQTLALIPPIFPAPTNIPPTLISWDRQGPAPEIDQVTFELSTDGIAYHLLGNATRLASSWSLSEQSFPAGINFYIRARGRTVGSASSGLIESIRQCYILPSSPPVLRFGRLGPALIYVAWPAWAANYELQSTTNLDPSSIWTTVPQPPIQFGDEYAVPVETLKAEEFFRLKGL